MEQRSRIEDLIKCRYCECWFSSNLDYESHIKTHWKLTRNGKGEWMPCDRDLYLTTRIRGSGSIILAGYRYVLVGDGKILYRSRIKPPRY